MKALILLMFSLAILFYFAHIAPEPVQASPLSNAEFLHLSKEQQEIWYKGALDALGYLAYEHDKHRASCIWGWFDEFSTARKDFLVEYFSSHPNKNPTGTLLTILKNDCRLLN